MGVSRALISCHITMSTMRLSPKNSVNANIEMPQNPVDPKAYLPAFEAHAALSKAKPPPLSKSSPLLLESVQMETCTLDRCKSLKGLKRGPQK